MGAPWHQKEVEILTEMRNAGKNYSEIASVLIARNIEAIKMKCARLGIKYEEEPEFDEAAFNRIMKGKK